MPPRRRPISKSGKVNDPLGCRPAAGLLGLLWVGIGLAPESRFFAQPIEDLRWVIVIAGLVGVIALMAWEERGKNQSADGWREILGGRDTFALGAILIAVGLLISSLASPVPLLGIRIGIRETFLAGTAVCLARREIRPAELRWLIGCLLAATGIQACLGLFQAFAGDAIGRTQMHGTLAQSEALSDFVGAGAAAAAIVAIKTSRKNIRTLAISIAAAGAATVFIAGGRGGALAGTAAFILAFILFPVATAQRRATFKWIAVAAIVAALLGAIGFGLLSRGARGSTLPSRLVQMFNPNTVPVRHRIGLIIITGNMIMDRPLTGAGPGRFAAGFSEMQGRLAKDDPGGRYWKFNEMLSEFSPNQAHCDPLQWWAEYGLLPLLGLFLMIMSALLKGAAIARRETDPWRAGIWAGIAAWSLVMWVSYPLHDPVSTLFFWSLIGIASSRETS